MISEHKIVLTKAQAACLRALRDGARSSNDVAVKTKFTLKTVFAALRASQCLGLAEQDPAREWHLTSQGETCLIDLPMRDRPREIDTTPSPNGRRLLELLDAPMEGRTIAQKLGVSRPGALNIVLRLHAQGHLKFGDLEDLHWTVMRADDDTPVLSRKQARVLSSVPSAYATNKVKISRAAKLAEAEVERALDRLIAVGFVEIVGEFNGATLYRSTAAEISHPQTRRDRPDAEPPHLPVHSDRVQTVLSAISGAGTLRIRDIRDRLGLPYQSMNSLMQYLKRKALIQKIDDLFDAPYGLTAMGRATLDGLAQRRAA